MCLYGNSNELLYIYPSWEWLLVCNSHCVNLFLVLVIYGLGNIVTQEDIQLYFQRNHNTIVSDLWTEDTSSPFWQWKTPSNWRHSLESENLDSIWQEIQQRWIHIKHGPDILIWGYKPSGIYMVKEEYSLSTSHRREPPLINWRKNWNPKLWPKISTFPWLLSHRCILTCNNILKWGLSGPSWCVLYNRHSESIDHLLDSCAFASELWDKVAEKICSSRRVTNNITETLQQWDVNPFQISILNILWELIPGFLAWNI